MKINVLNEPKSESFFKIRAKIYDWLGFCAFIVAFIAVIAAIIVSVSVTVEHIYTFFSLSYEFDSKISGFQVSWTFIFAASASLLLHRRTRNYSDATYLQLKHSAEYLKCEEVDIFKEKVERQNRRLKSCEIKAMQRCYYEFLRRTCPL